MTTTEPQALAKALVELLTNGQHHNAARPAVLREVGAERDRRRERESDSPIASPWTQLAELTAAVGQLAHAIADDHHATDELHRHLVGIAAETLAWLDAIEPDSTQNAY
jgi:hypothetical protein